MHVRSKLGTFKVHLEALDALEKLVFEDIYPVVNFQIDVFKLEQHKGEKAYASMLRMRTAFLQC